MISRIAVILPAIVTTLLLLYAPTIYCQDITCSDFCSIAAENDSHVIEELKNNKKEVLYLLLKAVDDSQLFNMTDNTVYALIGADFGRRFIVMPYDLLLLSIFLSGAFVGTAEVRISQYPDNCYIHLNTSQRDHCTFQALKRLHRLAVTNCTGQACGTFCKRQVHSFKSLDNIEVVCCPMVNDGEICNVEDRVPPLLVAFRYQSLIFSFILAINILKWLIQDIPSDQREANFGTSSLPEYINLKLVSKYEHEGMKDRIKRFWRKATFRLFLWMRYILYFIFTTFGFIISVWIQFYPYDFITIPTIYYITYPMDIIEDAVPIICLNGCLTLFIIIPVFHCGNQAVEYDIMCRDKKVVEFTEKHMVFQIKWCKDKWKELALKLYHSWFISIGLWLKCLTLLIVMVFYLPLAIINKNKYSKAFMHGVIGKADIIAYRLFHIFHCESKQLSYKNLMRKAVLYMIAVLYCLTTMGFALVFLQLLVRVFLTYTAFFAIHSKYFLAYIGPALPLVYFTVQIIQTYAQNKIKLSQDILELRDEVEAGVEDCLHASEGSMKIVFTITSDGVGLDLPVRLENLREIIEDKFMLMKMEHNIKLRDKQQSVFVHFKENDHNGNKIYDIYFSRFNDHLHDLQEKINEELSHQQQDLLRLKLKPFYYELEDATSDVTDVGIPMEFYNYLYYRAPGLALNVHNLLLRLPTIASIGFFFFTAISSFHDMGNITVLTSALSGTLLSFLGMSIGVSHFSINNLDDQKRKEIIKQYIIDYIIGYTFFDTSRTTIRLSKAVPPSLSQILDYNRGSFIKPSMTVQPTVV